MMDSVTLAGSWSDPISTGGAQCVTLMEATNPISPRLFATHLALVLTATMVAVPRVAAVVCLIAKTGKQNTVFTLRRKSPR